MINESTQHERRFDASKIKSAISLMIASDTIGAEEGYPREADRLKPRLFTAGDGKLLMMRVDKWKFSSRKIIACSQAD